MKLTYKVDMTPLLEQRLVREARRRSLSVEQVLPTIVAEYFAMWDDLEEGAVIMKGEKEDG